ncbi:hypothetical protein O3Q51_08310 [Cryomorphaceae bacterium 1068]|nr:hypothetical protein [Cryomorphaceae bacterium 1068]
MIQQFTGEFTFSLWMNGAEKIWQDPDYHPALDILVDLRGVTLLMEVKETKQIAKALADNKELTTTGRVALLMDSPRVAAFAQLLDVVRTDDSTFLMYTSEGWASKKLGIPFNIEQDLKSPDTQEISLSKSSLD